MVSAGVIPVKAGATRYPGQLNLLGKTRFDRDKASVDKRVSLNFLREKLHTWQITLDRLNFPAVDHRASRPSLRSCQRNHQKRMKYIK